jgi:hypothetical protein
VGKLPSLADYARLGERSEAFEALLGWLIEASEAGFRAPSRGRIQAFTFATPRTFLSGVLSPSRDAAGRSFPVAAAAALRDPCPRESPQLLPLLLENVWSTTESLLRTLIAGADPGGSWSADPLPDRAPAQHIYDNWLREMTTSDLIDLVFGGEVARAARCLATLDAAVAPHAGRQRRSTPLCLRLPLGQAGGASVCFWLDLLRGQLSWARELPSLFWSHDGRSGTLVLPVGTAALAPLGALWDDLSAADSICSVDAVDSGWEPPGLGEWVRRLEQPLPLAEVLSARDGAPAGAGAHRWWNRWRRS